MRTLISGGSGLVGSALVESLFAKGHTLRCLQRNRANESDRLWNTGDLDSSAGEHSHFDTVIHLAGENVVQGRWSNAKKERILNSRVEGTRQLVDYLSQLAEPPATLICASAVGYYGNRGEEKLTETSDQGTGFLADVCRQWETEATRAIKFGTRVVLLRFGLVLSPAGGALHKMITPFRLGLGGTLGKGQQYLSWVSIRDLMEVVDFVIHKEQINGPVNVVSPATTTNKEFTRTLGEIVDRPTILPAPPFLLRLLFGEMADEMLLASTRAIPEKLSQAGFVFQDTDLKETLACCVKKT